MAPSSARARAPASTRRPEKAQMAMTRPGSGTRRAMRLGTTKMPEPMTEPMSRSAPSASPSFRGRSLTDSLGNTVASCSLDLLRDANSGRDRPVHRGRRRVLPGEMDDALGLPGDGPEVLLADTEEGIATPHPGVLVPVLDRGALPELRSFRPDAGHFREGGLQTGVLGEESELLGVGSRREAHEDAPRSWLIDRHVVDASKHGVGEDPLPDAPGLVPEALLELHGDLHHLPVAERVDDLRLLRRERRGDLHVPEDLEGQGENELRRSQRLQRAALLEPDLGAVLVVNDPSHRAAVKDLVRKGAREGFRKLIVSSVDPPFVHVLVEPPLVHPPPHPPPNPHPLSPGPPLPRLPI